MEIPHAGNFPVTVIAGFFDDWDCSCAIEIRVVPNHAARMGRHFSYIDKNGNGLIERTEVAPYPALIQPFPTIEFENDDRLNKDEMPAYRLGT